MKDTQKINAVFQLSVIAWLTGWFIKGKFFHSYLLFQIYAYPIATAQFPIFFQNPLVATTAYYLPLLCFAGIIWRRQSVYKAISLLLLMCTVTLGLHMDTYNDMTFISSFWVALWLVWYAFHLHDHEHIMRHAPFLVQCMVAMIFLGGTVGKLTSEYWSGEAFYNLIINFQPQYLGRIIHDHFRVEHQKIFASVFSKMVILTEGALIFSPFFHYYLFCALSVLTVVTIVMFRSWTILSVLLCLSGMILSCLILVKGRKP